LYRAEVQEARRDRLRPLHAPPCAPIQRDGGRLGPGDNAKAHNHDTWGLVGVVQNEIQETRFRRRDDGSKPDYADLEVTAVLKNAAGMVSCLVPPDDDIHEMNNVSNRDTVEIHVYGKDLADMPRLRFDVGTKTAKIFASPKYDNC